MNAETIASITESDKQRFWEYVQKDGLTGCWFFAFDKGRFPLNGQRYSAFRFAVFISTGKWPTNRILKTCGNLQCVHPDHIYEAALIDSPQFRERFWSGVQPSTDDKCWPWMRCCQSKGYGQIYIGDTAHRAHRVAFYLANGKWPKVACHTCDNPICCNPKHIIDGTYQFNMLDKVRKGRSNSARGEKCGSSRFTESQVLDIRAEHAAGGISQCSLAKKYRCDQSLIHCIIKRKTWTHI